MSRHPGQIHRIGESDSEVIQVSKNLFLCSTVDSIAEEIAYGLYKDPHTMGWMTAMASLSDLAAVGADPLGLLFSATWKNNSSHEMKSGVARGLSQALKRCKTFLLGGDTGESLTTVLTGVAIGLCSEKPVTRLGIKPGDFIFTTGALGLGPAFAFQHLLNGTPLIKESDFRPIARVKEGRLLRGIASAAMDTSDGMAATLDTLCKLNEVGVEIDFSEKLIHRKAQAFCAASAMPTGSLMFGEHGDFELVLAVAPKNVQKALTQVRGLIPLGRAIRGKKSYMRGAAGKKEIKLDLMSELPKKSLDDFKKAVQLIVRETENLF
jgi:thiamine-monophosphate kinase